jgi:hypothetical protein
LLGIGEGNQRVLLHRAAPGCAGMLVALHRRWQSG